MTARGGDVRVTVVVVPREQFSVAKRSLDSIYEHTRIPFELIYIDGNSPANLKGWLEESARHRGFNLLRSNAYLSPNQARNWALLHVRTPFVAFVDNDLSHNLAVLELAAEGPEYMAGW